MVPVSARRSFTLGLQCTQFLRIELGTGEHGVGMGKRDYLIEELGPGTVDLMKTVKKAIDPYNLFNPGKVSATSQNGGNMSN